MRFLSLLLVAASAGAAEPVVSPDVIFKSASTVWHLGNLQDAAGKNSLTAVGAVTVGKRLLVASAHGSATIRALRVIELRSAHEGGPVP